MWFEEGKHFQGKVVLSFPKGTSKKKLFLRFLPQLFSFFILATAVHLRTGKTLWKHSGNENLGRSIMGYLFLPWLFHFFPKILRLSIEA